MKRNMSIQEKTQKGIILQLESKYWDNQKEQP